MDDSDSIEPLGFFTLDALRAGWYLLWRQLLRIVPVALGAVVVGLLLGRVGLGTLGGLLMGVGVLFACLWGAVLIPQLTKQWAEQWYGAELEGDVAIWWGVTWRACLASLVAAVIFTPPNFVALSLSTAFPNSALGALGSLITVLLGVANFGVTMLATGWAMSKVGVAQIAAMTTAPMPLVLAPGPAAATPSIQPTPAAISAPVAGSVAAAPGGVPRPTAAVAAAEGKRQCPKCGLYETERGSVIGWYCRICGWRETRAGR